MARSRTDGPLHAIDTLLEVAAGIVIAYAADHRATPSHLKDEVGFGLFMEHAEIAWEMIVEARDSEPLQ
jgi:hypothetical protein